MLTTLTDMEPKQAETVLSRLMKTLLPDASPRTQAQQFETLSPIERDILREVGERLGLADELPSRTEVPAVLELLSREVSNVVLSKANVEELQARTFDKTASSQRPTRRSRARVLISSSSEGRAYAHSLQISLEFSALTELWTDERFDMTSHALESLIRDVGRFDFAVFVLTTDDISSFRGKGSPSRSNLAFEAGLFVGRLGANRTFFVVPKHGSGLAFLGDLAGIVTLDYDPFAASTEAALGSTSHQIAAQIQRFGPVGSKESVSA
jgi:predicted nucleotide-binding protein